MTCRHNKNLNDQGRPTCFFWTSDEVHSRTQDSGGLRGSDEVVSLNKKQIDWTKAWERRDWAGVVYADNEETIFKF